MHGATGNIYVGLHEFEQMAFLLHCLRSEDTFIDVGANVGSYTVLASAVVGARTIAFEPIESEYKGLMANIQLNGIAHLVDARNVAVGAHQGSATLTKGCGALSSVISDSEDGIIAPLTTLDQAISGKDIRLIKMDVEGFEAEVIKGAHRVLSGDRPLALIIEMSKLSKKYGASAASIHNSLIDLGFRPYRYSVFTRQLTEGFGTERYGQNIKIYIKGIAEITDRVINAQPFEVLGKRI
jgi:FkbM family methyltransferase